MAEPIQNTEAIYDSEIAPLMTQIIAICDRAKIPVLASFQLTSDVDDPDGAMLCTTAIIPSDDTVGLALNLRRACEIIQGDRTSITFGMRITKHS
jgi:hypothetical protein